MRLGVVLWLLGLTSALSFQGHAEDSPPDYVAPAKVQRLLAAAHATVVVSDTRLDRPSTSDEKVASDPLSEAELAPILEDRLKPALAPGGLSLVIRVKLIEGREVSGSPAEVRAVVEVAVELEGRTLASTRGTSTLWGSIGGMSPETNERIQGAVIDAFERSVLRSEFIDATNKAITSKLEAEAPPTVVAETRNEWAIHVHESSGAAHVVSAVFDGGATYSFAARYLHDHLYGGSGLLWGGYGLEARFISDDMKRLDAVGGLAVLHGGAGFEQGFSAEIGLGPGGRDAVRAIGVAGVYYSFYYVDLGFTYQFVVSPTRELEPLAGAHFGIRINVPFNVHGVTVRCRSPLPCSPELLPFSGASKRPAATRSVPSLPRGLPKEAK